MTDPVKEQLSACLDGELREAELDLLLRQIARDPQLRGAMGRYALIGETLRSQGSMAAPADFAAKISAAIASEPEVATTVRAKPARISWLKPAAGFAVAAGVAAIAILALRQPEPTAPTTYVADAAPTQAESSPEAASYIVPASTDSTGFVPAARLTNYVVAHSEYSSPLGRRSVLTGVLAAEDATDADDVTDLESEPDTTVVTQP